MNPRVRDVVLLLEALEDVFPAPDTWTGRLVQSSARRGPAPSRWQKCLPCDGSGMRKDVFHRVTTCMECRGYGRVHVDDYTNERVSSAESGLVIKTDTVRCDRCGGDGAWKFKRCDLCGGSGRRSVTRDDQGDRERRQREQTLNVWSREPAFDTLLRTLDRLRELAPMAFRLCWTLHVTKARNVESLVPSERFAYREALEWLAHRIADHVTVPGWVRQSDRRARERGNGVRGRWANNGALVKRDKEIRKLEREGRAVQWIAREFGISVSQVYRVLKPSPQ